MSGRLRVWATVFAGTALATAWVGWHRAARAATELTGAQREVSGLELRAQELKTQVQQEQAKFAAVESDNDGLLARIAEKTAAARPMPLTRQEINERLRAAQAAEAQGEVESALAGYLWCYDEGFLRNATVVQRLWQLGEREPRARQALRERRDRAQAEILTGGESNETLGDFLLLNQTLQEAAVSLVFYDRLPPDDTRRKALLGPLQQAFLDARRYQEALLGLPSPREMAMWLAPPRPLPPEVVAAREAALARVTGNSAEAEAMRLTRQRAEEAQRTSRMTVAGPLLEALAATGRLDEARELLEKVRGFDASPRTTALIRRHLERAGRLELWEASTAPQN